MHEPISISSSQINITTSKDVSVDAFVDLLYRSTLAERRPVDDPVCMKGMIDNSNLIIGAWKDELLVGVSRAVTDFHYACYVSDLAVDRAFQNSGIGRAMINETRAVLQKTCRIILIAAPAAKDYYAKLGFEYNDRCWVLE